MTIKTKYQWLVGRKVKISVIRNENGLERICLESRKVTRVTPCEKDCKIIFEEEPDKIYLYSDIKNINRPNCNRIHAILRAGDECNEGETMVFVPNYSNCWSILY